MSAGLKAFVITQLCLHAIVLLGAVLKRSAVDGSRMERVQVALNCGFVAWATYLLEVS